ncbi:MAG: saccharopine dehydrogenase NADP-binding domain-containing protein [Ilumatobacteraceae bacterium]
MPSHQFDLVVFGATSFVGQILTRRLVERIGTNGDVRWAIAGRSADKLASVAALTGADDVERIVADATDAAAMQALATSTQMVVSTVGPYALYGSNLVAAVAAAGVGYCDLTGEPQWMRAMIDAHGTTAATSGARIVHACGFDSIPSDLGVWFTQQRAIEILGEPCTSVGLRVKHMKGGASGGTVASMINMMKGAARDADLREVLTNPYALAPEGMRSGSSQPNMNVPQHDRTSGEWTAPFVMAATNPRVVHRTHALLGRPWGDDFRYGEAMLMGDGPLGAAKATALTGGLAGFGGMAAMPPGRALLGRFLPEPGEGPSPEAQQAGCFDIRLYGETASGSTIVTKVTGDRDPGYGSTAKMLAEAALSLVEEPVTETGFLTPATAFGNSLIDRLVEHAGLTFDVID